MGQVMRLLNSIMSLQLLYLAIAFPTAWSQGYNDVGTVSGHVEIQDHPSLGKTPCRNCEFLLQRVDCRKCLVDVKTDSSGDYSLRIGLGKWRIIMTERREASDRSFDLLSSGQPRTFEIKSPSGKLIFDVKTVTFP